MEPTEIQEFGKEMKEAGEASLTHVSLIISVLAVMVAMVTVMGHRTHTEAVLEQARASDMWNEYQAHKIRSSLESFAVESLSEQATSNPAQRQAALQAHKTHIDKLDKEAEGEQDQAKEHEFDVRIAERKATRWDLGEALLEIAVVLSSVTLLTRKSGFALGGLLIGIAGLIIAASALFVR